VRPFNADGTFHPFESGEKLRRTAVRGAAVSIGGQTAGFVLQMCSVVVLARLLTPADFGIVTMVTTFNLLFRSFGLNGFTELIMQREELTEDLVSNLFWINLAIGTFLTIAFAASGKLIALFYHNSAVVPVVVGMSSTIVLGSLGYIHVALLQRAMHFRTAALINFIGVVAYVLFSVICALEGLHYWALVWGCVSQYVVMAVLAWLMCNWIPKWPGRAPGCFAALVFAFNVYLHFAFNYLTRNTDNLIVGSRFGAPMLGMYKRAYDLFVLAATQLLSPISAVAVSTLSRVRDDREQFERFFLRALSILAFLGMGIGADFCVVGKDLIRVLLGPQWNEAGRIFTLFGPGIGVMLLYNTHGWIHLSIGRPERWFRWGLVEFGCTVILFFLMLPWGPSGVAFAWTASFFLLMIPGFWYAGRPIELSVKPIISSIWRFFAASVIAGLLSFLIVQGFEKPFLVSSIGAAATRLVIVSVIFFGLYLLAVIGLHGSMKPIKETISLIRDLLPSKGDLTILPNRLDAGDPALSRSE
jgi:O-antigen/teichoic acid export membrane protein